MKRVRLLNKDHGMSLYEYKKVKDGLRDLRKAKDKEMNKTESLKLKSKKLMRQNKLKLLRKLERNRCPGATNLRLNT